MATDYPLIYAQKASVTAQAVELTESNSVIIGKKGLY